MKISTFARINTGLLLLVAIALGLSLFIGIKHFDEPIKRTQSFSEFKTFLNDQILTEISNYLSYGDASSLSRAETALTELDNRLVKENDADLAEIHHHLVELKEFLSTEARAAGKLAGSEDTLIIQNERETRDEISALLDYAKLGAQSNTTISNEYSYAAQELTFLLLERSIRRQQILLAGSDDLQDIAAQNTEMLRIVANVNDLERLGITDGEAEEDLFASLMGLESEEESAPKEDKAEEIIRNIRTLVSRFPKEIGGTIALKKRVKNSNEQLNGLIANINAKISELEKNMVDQFSSTVDLAIYFTIGIIGMIVVLSAFIDQTQRSIASRINKFVPYLRTFSEGDFTRTVEVKAMTAEIREMKDSANTLKDNLANLIGTAKFRSDKVVEIGDKLHEASEYVAAQMGRQMERTESITSSVDQLSSSFSEMAKSSAQTANSATKINTAAQESMGTMESANSEAKTLAHQVHQTSEKIAALGEYADNIGAVLEVISSIAEQTNLLALNAAIEAARAGEHGRGFAVVADEVRSLSGRTADSTMEIQKIITQIQDQAQSCKRAMEDQVDLAEDTVSKSESANDSVRSIVDAIVSVQTMAEEIAVTIEQQAKAVDIINGNIHDVRDSISETNKSSQSTAELSQQLNTENEGLKQAMTAFRF